MRASYFVQTSARLVTLAALTVFIAATSAGQTPPSVSFVAIRSYTVGQNPVFLAVGDFNADGNSDVAVANKGSGNVSVCLLYTSPSPRD